MKYKGTAHRYGRDIDTDVIIPARYLNTSDPAELAKHCLEDLDTAFVERVQPGDVIVAEENFGCGSSREHAPIAVPAVHRRDNRSRRPGGALAEEACVTCFYVAN